MKKNLNNMRSTFEWKEGICTFIFNRKESKQSLTEVCLSINNSFFLEAAVVEVGSFRRRLLSLFLRRDFRCQRDILFQDFDEVQLTTLIFDQSGDRVPQSRVFVNTGSLLGSSRWLLPGLFRSRKRAQIGTETATYIQTKSLHQLT